MTEQEGVPFAPRDAMNRLSNKTLEDYARQDDADPDDEGVDEFDEESGFFPSLFDRR